MVTRTKPFATLHGESYTDKRSNVHLRYEPGYVAPSAFVTHWRKNVGQ
jgi:hypothetical protein